MESRKNIQRFGKKSFGKQDKPDKREKGGKKQRLFGKYRRLREEERH